MLWKLSRHQGSLLKVCELTYYRYNPKSLNCNLTYPVASTYVQLLLLHSFTVTDSNMCRSLWIILTRIRYAVITSVCAIMTSEDFCFNLTSKLTACISVIWLLISHLFATTVNYIVVAIIKIIKNQNNYTSWNYIYKKSKWKGSQSILMNWQCLHKDMRLCIRLLIWKLLVSASQTSS